MLADASPEPTTESHKRKRMQVIALAFPSFRPECMWIFVVLRVVVVGHGVDVDSHPLSDWNVSNKVVGLGLANENSISRTIEPSCLILKPFDVLQFPQILKGYIRIVFYHFFDLFSDYLLDFWVITEIVDHHHEQVSGSISSRY